MNMADSNVTVTPGAHNGEDSDNGSTTTDDAELALQGIVMLLNNEWKPAQELFRKHKEFSPLMHAGDSFVTFLQALMTFEDEKLVEAMKALQETEKKCENNGSFVTSLKKKFKKKSSENQVSVEDKYQRRIIVGDAILYQAILTFINQDISSMIKGGWLMRKAYKIYEKVYKDIRVMHAKHPHRALPKINSSRQMFPADDSTADSSRGGGDRVSSNTASPDTQALSRDSSTSSLRKMAADTELSLEVVERLLGAVCFGYGSFQLLISMLPPKVLKIIEFLGFEGDREVGLGCLDVCSHSKDMKSPMATLGLLQYHTVIRAFFALDGANVHAGVEEANVIMERCEKEYPNSALFLFFKGRTHRLKAEIPEALSTYRVALDACADQREVQLICYHEIGWCELMKLDWQEALRCFMKLKVDSRWSKCYYAYLTALCQGACGDLQASAFTFKEVPALMKKKNNQIEAFVVRRAKKLEKLPACQQHLALLLLEVLYLWNCVPQCTPTDMDKMLEVCNNQTNRNTFHLRSLVEGAIYREKGDLEMAAQCFDEVLARHQGMKDDHHIATFAMYELGTLLTASAQTYDKGKKYLLQAKEKSDYDFENRLNVRIHAALKRMKDEGTPV